MILSDASKDDVVSIPIGFSIELRPADADLGYWMVYEVSIPIGFSIELRRPSAPRKTSGSRVSIPIGFSIELRRDARGCRDYVY